MKKIFVIIAILLSILQIKGQTFYSQMAAQYAAEGDYEKAIELEEEGLEMWERIHGKENIDYINSLTNLGNYKFRLEDFAQAIQLGTQALIIFLETFGEKHPDYTVLINNLSIYYSRIGNYNQAIQLGTQALEIRKEILGERHLDYATSLSNLAQYYSDLGNYEEALSLGIKALEIYKEILGESNPWYATTLDNLATYYSDLGKYEEALSLGIKALEIRKEILGERHTDYATSLSNLAICNSRLGNYEDAIYLGTQALEILKEILGERHPDYATSLSNLAQYYSDLGNYVQAIFLSTEAMKIFKEIFGEKHQKYATSLSNMAIYNSNLGNYEDAIYLGTQALEIRKEILGERHPDYATSLSNLAQYYSDLGNFGEAINLATHALNIIKEILGEKHSIYALSLSVLGNNYSDLGNYEEALSLGIKALEIHKEIFGESHPDYAASLDNLAIYYTDLGNYEEALSLGIKALEIRKEILGERHPDYAASLSNLAIYNSRLGDYEDAIYLGTQALEIRKEILGERHPDYAFSLINLAVYNSYLANFEKAIHLCTKALDILNEVLDEKHPHYARFLKTIIFLNHKIKNSEFIINNSKIVSEVCMKLIQNNFQLISHFNQNNFWNLNKNWFNIDLPLYTYLYSDQNLRNQSYNGAIFSKGLLLNSEMEFDQFIGETRNEELLEKYNEIKILRLQLNKLYEKPIGERYCDTDSLERHVNELERKLMEESSEYGDYTKNLSVTWEDVQKGLGKKDAAIEFVHFPLNQDSTMYMAYVLRPEMESPAIVKLFEEKDLSKLTGSKLNSDKTNIKGSQLIWGKLQSELKGVENVYFAPDGILHQIPIEYLPDFEDEDKLISDRYNLHRVSSTRQLALRKDTKKSDKAVVYGGIQYDTNPELLAQVSRKYENITDRGFQPWYNIADTLSMRSGVKYLPFTLTEATSVSTMLEESHQQPMLITGNEATEASFKNLSGQKNGILHIATHGFYWQEKEADKQAQMNDRLLFMSQFGDNARRNLEDKALTRTGLFMAGANNALSGKEIPEDIDDGILTASEIANLDLRGTDLVVLSACQTGMGDIGGDGVFGLQRGFKKAGVNSLLMSLWDVDDAATGMFMTEFYRNFTEGKTKRESLKAAQDKVRNFKGEINGEYRNFSNPRYWAAFILLDALN